MTTPGRCSLGWFVVWWLQCTVCTPIFFLVIWGMFLYLQYQMAQLGLRFAAHGDVRLKIGIWVTELTFVRDAQGTGDGENPPTNQT